MAILAILQYPDLRLRRHACLVQEIESPKIQKIINDMRETLANSKNCAALAATQLDLAEPHSIVVINPAISEEHAIPDCLINIEILSKSGEVAAEEGCMSIVPQDIRAKVKRAAEVKVFAFTHQGEKIEFVAEDFLARCMQHEYDHLQGILFIDYLSKLKRSRIDKKINKLCKSI